MIKEVKNLLEKCENQFFDGEEKEVFKVELKKINDRLFDLQMERLTQYINDKVKVENLPDDEKKLQKEMTDLTVRINKFIHTN
jgi:hypothetical protein